METYTQLFAKLKAANDSWECVGPQPSSRVDEIECKYKITLPRSFRAYLTELGGVEFLDAHYTSIDDDYLDDVDGFMCNTNMIRSQVGMPDSLLALEYDLDADRIACLDLSAMNGDECPVIWYHPFLGRVIGPCSDNFRAFFESIVREWTAASSGGG